MGKVVQVKPDFSAVALPPSNLPFKGGSSTTLTDAEYAALAPATLRAVTVTQSNVTDPVRSSSEYPQSLSDTLAKAKAYVAAGYVPLSAIGNEIAYAEVGGSGMSTAVSGSLVYSQISGAGIAVPVSTDPVVIEYEGLLNVVTAGGGAVYLVLAETTSGSMVVIHSCPNSVVPTASGQGSKVVSTSRGAKRIGPVTSPRTFALFATQFPDSASPLTCQVVNGSLNPTWIGAYRR